MSQNEGFGNHQKINFLGWATAATATTTATATLRLRVYTVKNTKNSKFRFLSLRPPDSADRSVSSRRYYRNLWLILGIQEKIKYTKKVQKTSKITKISPSLLSADAGDMVPSLHREEISSARRDGISSPVLGSLALGRAHLARGSNTIFPASADRSEGRPIGNGHRLDMPPGIFN